MITVRPPLGNVCESVWQRVRPQQVLKTLNSFPHKLVEYVMSQATLRALFASLPMSAPAPSLAVGLGTMLSSTLPLFRNDFNSRH